MIFRCIHKLEAGRIGPVYSRTSTTLLFDRFGQLVRLRLGLWSYILTEFVTSTYMDSRDSAFSTRLCAGTSAGVSRWGRHCDMKDGRTSQREVLRPFGPGSLSVLAIVLSPVLSPGFSKHFQLDSVFESEHNGRVVKYPYNEMRLPLTCAHAQNA